MTRIRPGEVVEGRYRLDRLLGEGGYGAVYAATHLEMGTPLALKLLHAHHSDSEETTARFRREARNTARLRHPHCVTVFDFGRSELAGQEVFFLAMELLDGETLADLLRRGPIEPHRAMVILDQILLALEAAHGLGLIHRDLKPDNVFLVKTGGLDHVKVLDFGIAKALESEDSASITASGTVIGTPAFMSPEQCRGVGIDPRSDLYSLGCVAWAMLAGQPPFKRDSTLGYLLAHVQDPPGDIAHVAFLHEIPPQLRRFIATCLEKDPKDRYPTASAARQALAVTGTHPAALMTARGRALPPPPKARRGWLLGAVALAVCALAVGLWPWLSADDERSADLEVVRIESGDERSLGLRGGEASPSEASVVPGAPTALLVRPDSSTPPAAASAVELVDAADMDTSPDANTPSEDGAPAIAELDSEETSRERSPSHRLTAAELSALTERLCASARRLPTRTHRTVEAAMREALARESITDLDIEVVPARTLTLTFCTGTPPARDCASCAITPGSATTRPAAAQTSPGPTPGRPESAQQTPPVSNPAGPTRPVRPTTTKPPEFERLEE